MADKAFLMLDDVPGDADDKYHQGWIDLMGATFTSPETTDAGTFQTLLIGIRAFGQPASHLRQIQAMKKTIKRGQVEVANEKGQVIFHRNLQNITVSRFDAPQVDVDGRANQNRPGYWDQFITVGLRYTDKQS